MSSKLLIPLFALAVLLSACTTSVISDEQREIPIEEQPMEDSVFTGTKNAQLDESFIAFVGSKKDIISHECKFNEFATEVVFDNGMPVSLTASIAINSIETDTEKLTAHLLTDDFFSAETYDSMTFTSTGIEEDSDGVYVVTGTLTIKDVSHEEVITMNISETLLTAMHTIDRTLYGVGGPAEGLKAIDAEIPLEIKVVLQ